MTRSSSTEKEEEEEDEEEEEEEEEEGAVRVWFNILKLKSSATFYNDAQMLKRQ